MNRFYFLGASLVIVGAMASACGDDESTATTTTSSTASSSSSGTGGTTTTTSSAGGGGSTTTTTGSGGGGGATAVDCATYCSTIEAACTAGNDQYGTNGTESFCVDTCATWMAGTLGDTGDTIGCRLEHAMHISDAAVDCVHAGPMAVGMGAGGAGGAGGAAANDPKCGASACDNFCELADAVCTGGNQQWATVAACKADCQTFLGDATAYDAGDTSGDTFECRMYHLTAAADDPNTHCGHIILSTAGNVPCK
jgi:hypothetical protein